MSTTWSLRVRILALGLAAIAPAATLAADEPKGDLKKLQGEWTSKDDQGESTWKFEGDTLSLNAPGREYAIKVKVDGEAKPEKTIDFDVLEASPNAKGYKAAGIYKFTGDDKVTICFASADAGRPDDYEADFMNTFTFELSRKK
jgi:uncharacterized protein (TIGR03067 family)